MRELFTEVLVDVHSQIQEREHLWRGKLPGMISRTAQVGALSYAPNR